MSGRYIVFAAPHRLLFLTGSAQLAMSLIWWTVALIDIHLWPLGLAIGELSPTMVHGPIMLYLVVPSFFFGFLLTVFPRWLGYPDLEARDYAPAGISFAAAAALSWAGLWTGSRAAFIGAFCLALCGFLAAFAVMLQLLLRERKDRKGPTWHGWSMLAAVIAGMAGAFCAILFAAQLDAGWIRLANRVGLLAFILPVFVTVSHRMIPFFATNVIQGYERWRPFWILAAYWAVSITLLAAELCEEPHATAVAALLLAAITGLMTFKWWPGAAAPGLFWVLIIAFAWAPVGFALESLAAMGIQLGRAPDHALTVGFAAGLVIAMVTRVTQGHSGRPLVMPRVAWLAYSGVQLATLARVWAGVADESSAWLVLATTLLTIAVLPWTLRNGLIYMRPRIDGEQG
jgi:uncharacterized protein involved in response to NO